MHGSAKRLGLDSKDAQVSASVGLGKTSDTAYGLAVELDLFFPNVAQEKRQELADAAHATCPYSNATRGNVEVTLVIVD